MEDLETSTPASLISFEAAEPASIDLGSLVENIDLGSLVENAEDMGLARATAVAIAQADRRKAADFVALLADFLTRITAESDGDGGQRRIHRRPTSRSSRPSGGSGDPGHGTLPGPGRSGIRSDPWLRLLAAEAKWRITGDPTAALAVATEMLSDQEWWLVGHAADLLGKLGQAAQPAVADLERLLGHEQDYTRRHVRAAMERVLS